MLVYFPTYLVNEHCSTQIEDLQRRKWIHLDLEGRLVYCVTLDVESSSVNPWMSVLIKVRKRLTHWLKLAGFQINTLASQQRPAASSQQSDSEEVWLAIWGKDNLIADQSDTFLGYFTLPRYLYLSNNVDRSTFPLEKYFAGIKHKKHIVWFWKIHTSFRQQSWQSCHPIDCGWPRPPHLTCHKIIFSTILFVTTGRK